MSGFASIRSGSAHLANTISRAELEQTAKTGHSRDHKMAAFSVMALDLFSAKINSPAARIANFLGLSVQPVRDPPTMANASMAMKTRPTYAELAEFAKDRTFFHVRFNFKSNGTNKTQQLLIRNDARPGQTPAMLVSLDGKTFQPLLRGGKDGDPDAPFTLEQELTGTTISLRGPAKPAAPAATVPGHNTAPQTSLQRNSSVEQGSPMRGFDGHPQTKGDPDGDHFADNTRQPSISAAGEISSLSSVTILSQHPDKATNAWTSSTTSAAPLAKAVINLSTPLTSMTAQSPSVNLLALFVPERVSPGPKKPVTVPTDVKTSANNIIGKDGTPAKPSDGNANRAPEVSTTMPKPSPEQSWNSFAPHKNVGDTKRALGPAGAAKGANFKSILKRPTNSNSPVVAEASSKKPDRQVTFTTVSRSSEKDGFSAKTVENLPALPEGASDRLIASAGAKTLSHNQLPRLSASLSMQGAAQIHGKENDGYLPAQSLRSTHAKLTSNLDKGKMSIQGIALPAALQNRTVEKVAPPATTPKPPPLLSAWKRARTVNPKPLPTIAAPNIQPPQRSHLPRGDAPVSLGSRRQIELPSQRQAREELAASIRPARPEQANPFAKAKEAMEAGTTKTYDELQQERIKQGVAERVQARALAEISKRKNPEIAEANAQLQMANIGNNINASFGKLPPNTSREVSIQHFVRDCLQGNPNPTNSTGEFLGVSRANSAGRTTELGKLEKDTSGFVVFNPQDRSFHTFVKQDGNLDNFIHYSRNPNSNQESPSQYMQSMEKNNETIAYRILPIQ